MSACRYCHATIRFVRLDTGKAIPVNPQPDNTGTVAADWQGTTLVGYVTSRTKPLRDGYRLYRAHRADCHPDKPRTSRPPSLLEAAGDAGRTNRRRTP